MKYQVVLSSMSGIVCALAMGAVATAQEIEVIYTKIPGHPTSVIPGAVDLNGQPAFAEFRNIEDVIGSPDGSHWMLKGRSQQGSDLETILMIGSGIDGSVFAQKNQPVHGGAAGEVYNFFGSGVGRFNDNNDFAFSARAMGGSSSTAQKVIRVFGDDAEIVLQQGDAYLGLQAFPGQPGGNELVGNSVGSVHLMNDGTIGVQDNTIQNLHSSMRPALFYNNIMFQQANVSNFLGIDGKANETWISMDSNAFYTTPDTSPISLGTGHWAALGRKLGQTFPDRVLVVDGAAVLESGAAIPGSPLVVDGISAFDLRSNGDWYARGDADGGIRAWVVRNGEVIAKTDDQVPGADERWAASFSRATGNNNGDWVIIGRTDNDDSEADEVIVVNDQVVVREGDPVDLDGNGSFDDDVFIGRGNPDSSAFNGDAFLSDDGVLYFLANLRDAQGNEYNTQPAFSVPVSFLRVAVDLAEPCVGDLTGDGSVNVSDMLALLGEWGSCADCDADLNNDDEVNVSDLLMLLGAWGDC